jgi:hypothetical protein
MRIVGALLIIALYGPLQTLSKGEPQLKRRPEQGSRSTIPAISGMQCITFDPKTLTENDVADGPIMHGHLHWLYGNRKRRDNRRVLGIIQSFRMDASCWIDDPGGYPFHFMLVDGKAPFGNMKGEDCSDHHFVNLKLVDFGPGEMAIRDGRGPRTGFRIISSEKKDEWWLYWFKTREAAEASFSAIHTFGFSQVCYVGRPTPSMEYLKAR